MSEPTAPTPPQLPPQWEYRVIHINVDNSTPPQPPDPQVASQKLGGTLIPEFISREFPQQYGPEQRAQAAPKHPAEQLQHFLNLLGKEGWEMTTTAQPPRPIATPCVKVCAVDGVTGYCLGCRRTLPEIAAWAGLDEAGKREVWALLPERRRALGAAFLGRDRA